MTSSKFIRIVPALIRLEEGSVEILHPREPERGEPQHSVKLKPIELVYILQEYQELWPIKAEVNIEDWFGIEGTSR